MLLDIPSSRLRVFMILGIVFGTQELLTVIYVLLQPIALFLLFTFLGLIRQFWIYFRLLLQCSQFPLLFLFNYSCDSGDTSGKFFFSGTFAKLWKVTISFIICASPLVYPSVHMDTGPTERIFLKFNIWDFFKILSRKLKFLYCMTRMTGTLYV